jgi:predicted permease
LTVVGRLAHGVSAEDAQLELRVVDSAARDGLPEHGEHLNPEVVPTSYMTFAFPKGGIRALPEFYLAQMLTLVPLLIACVNVGLLTFARTATRSMEFAMRTALGASRARIVAQVFTEALVLSLLAAGAGLLLLYWLPRRALPAIGFPMPYWLAPTISAATVLRAIGLALASAFMAGVIPVLRATGPRLQQTIQRARSRRSGTRFGGVASVMIVADVAVAVAAVGFAIGVYGRVAATFANEKADGIRAERYLSLTLSITEQSEPTRVAQIQQAIVDRLRVEPGVRAVAMGTALPRMDHPGRFVEVDGEDLPAGTRGHAVRTADVAVGFFEALRTPMISGRAFDSVDLAAGLSPVIVNTTFVENVLGGRAAVGRRVRYRTEGSDASGPWHEIVGVVGHLGMHSLSPAKDAGLYHPLVPGSVQSVRLAIEADGDPAALAPRVREIAQDVDPRAVIASPITLDQVFEGDWYLMAALVAGGLVLIGVLLTLAASGLYAIMSFSVAERTREIGIRVALGADRIRIALHVARRALIQIAIGVLLGLPVATAVFFEMQEDAGRDPSALIAVLAALVPGVAVMMLVGFAACLAPTVRALRISPVDALRGDS